ncbi:hypothetical protein B9Z65_6149 [Elsinoe australis]|uniref:Uncharacterized protein n=1 Tax=Elsinoe australis TaxID=40998 RepID=A0A2P8A7U0_9PEZI|nr:hypothetical protein B9Z65_6149 [Elsinoe australis]
MPRRKNVDWSAKTFWKRHPKFWLSEHDFTTLSTGKKGLVFKAWYEAHPNAECIAPLKGVPYYDSVSKLSHKPGKKAFHARQSRLQFQQAQARRVQAHHSSAARLSYNKNNDTKTASEHTTDSGSSDSATSRSRSESHQPIIKQEPVSDASGKSTTSPASTISAQPQAIATSASEDRGDGRNESGSLSASQAVVLFNSEHRVSDWLNEVSHAVKPANVNASRKRSASEIGNEPTTESRKVRVTTLLDLPPSVPEAVGPTALSAFDCGLLKDESELRLWSLGLQFRSWVTRVA